MITMASSKALAKRKPEEIEGERKLTLLDIADHVAQMHYAYEALPETDTQGREQLLEAIREFVLTAGADKIDGIGWFLRKSEAELKAYKETEAIIASKKKRINRAIDRMYDLLLYAMTKMNIKSLGGQITTVTLVEGRDGNPEVFDQSKLPPEYWKTVSSDVPDMEKIEAALKAKVDIPGVRLKRVADYIQVK
jgi:hypothetical protein